MCGYHGIYDMYKHGCNEFQPAVDKRIQYLLDLETKGIVDPSVFVNIGDEYNPLYSRHEDPSKARFYYRRAMDLKYGPAYSCCIHDTPLFGTGEELHAFLEAKVEEGAIGKHDMLLYSVIEHISEGSTDYEHLIAPFTSLDDMARHYCWHLIQAGSPVGYYQMAFCDSDPTPDTHRYIFDEADRRGLANYMIYSRIIESFMYVSYKYSILV